MTLKSIRNQKVRGPTGPGLKGTGLKGPGLKSTGLKGSRLRHMASTAVIVLALAHWAGLASGQIAAPRLNGMAITAGTPYNPAVTVMQGRSSIVLNTMSTTVTESPPGMAGIQVAQGTGGAGRFDLVWESFGMTLVGYSQDLVLEAPAPPGNLELSGSLGAFSWRGGEIMAFGMGIQSEKVVDPGFSERSRTPSAGAVLQLGGFSIGGSLGEENISRSETFPVPVQGEADRTVWNIGLAVRWREGPEGLHLQAWQQQAKGSSLGAFQVEEEKTTGGTIEAVIFNILFSMESSSTERIDPNTGDVSTEETDSTVGVGLDFGEGLGLLVGVNLFEEDEMFNNIHREVETSIVSLGWLF